jgi:CHAT domain-containing protein/Tfp pilus assembly protein PilF
MAEAERQSRRADSLMQAGRYDEADSAVSLDLEARQRILGPEHAEIATALSTKGVIRLYQNDPDAAEPFLQQALEMRRRIVGDEHPEIAGDLANLSQVQLTRGDPAAAAPNAREAIAIYRRLSTEGDPTYPLLVNNLASILLSLGDYSAAEPLFQEALARLRDTAGVETAEVVMLTANLASLRVKMGDEDGAEPAYRQAIDIQRKIFPGDHPNTALYLNSLATLLQRRGDFDEAEKLTRESLEMQRRLLKESDPDLAVTLRNLGLILADQKRYAEATDADREAIAIWKRALSASHPQVAMGLYDLGSSLAALGDSCAAETVLRQALAIRKRQLGERHPYTVATLHILGRLSAARGDLAGADSLLSACADRYEAARLRAGAGFERATFLESPYGDLAAVKLAEGRYAAAWPVAERERGRVLADLLRAAHQTSLSSTESARRDSLQRSLGGCANRLDAYQEVGNDDTSAVATKRVDDARSKLLIAEAALNSFQLEMAERYPVAEGQAVPLESIQRILEPQTAIIGWCDTEVRPGKPEIWAYMIRAQGSVQWARAKHTTTAGACRNLRRALARPDESIVALKRDSHTVWTERIEPLIPFLKDVRHIVVVPSGTMLGLPIETLTDAEGNYLGDRFAVTYSPSAGIYAWLKQEEERGRQAGETEAAPQEDGMRTAALLVGDPPFNEGQRQTMLDEIQADPDAGRGKAFPTADTSRTTLRSVSQTNPQALPRLPGSRNEVQEVAHALPNALLLLGPAASEPRLAGLASSDSLRSFRVIHLATHALVDNRRPGRSALVLSQVDLPNRLAAAIDGKPIYDGMLTAEEIVRTWKLRADVVTLSACQTALGREIAGEGYVGLTDAFLQAGAKSVLVSLWEVDDRATSLLMQRFYRNLAQSWSQDGPGKRTVSLTKAAALGDAREWLRDYVDSSGGRPYGHPYYWAAFVLIGDPD